MMLEIVMGVLVCLGLLALVLALLLAQREDDATDSVGLIDLCRTCIYKDRSDKDYPCFDCSGEFYNPIRRRRKRSGKSRKAEYEPLYKDMTGKDYSCDNCVHDRDEWFTEPCALCFTEHCGYEPKEGVKE